MRFASPAWVVRAHYSAFWASQADCSATCFGGVYGISVCPILNVQEENRKEVSGFVQGLGMLKSSDSRGRGLFGKAIEVALKKLSAFVKPKPIENVPNGDASSESSAPHSPDQRPAAYTDGIHV
eukprot:GHVT01087262.1.p2 GENE.GHVT01087262.1~~GHVT01087262.1.p2  ORF type:complete len:124 (+),score=14.92 GHVT01087262.1:4496-4867(+)